MRQNKSMSEGFYPTLENLTEVESSFTQNPECLDSTFSNCDC